MPLLSPIDDIVRLVVFRWCLVNYHGYQGRWTKDERQGIMRIWELFQKTYELRGSGPCEPCSGISLSNS